MKIKSYIVLGVFLASVLGLGGIAVADPPSPPPPPPPPSPGASTNVNVQDLSAFQACGVGYEDTTGELSYCDKPYRIQVRTQTVYCENPSSLPEGTWLNPEPDRYDRRYHGCNNFGKEMITKTFMTCGDPRNYLKTGSDRGTDTKSQEIKEYLIGVDGYYSKAGHDITGDPREDDPGPTLTDDILSDMDQEADPYKSVELNNPDDWACKGGAALSNRHDRGEMKVAAAASKSSAGGGPVGQMYVDKDVINASLNTVIPACVNRIPMMRLKAQIIPGEGNPSDWRGNSVSTSKGLFAKHESVSYGSKSDINSVKDIEFPTQKSFKRNYNLTFDLRSYRAWAWRERFPEAVDKAVERLEASGKDVIDSEDLTDVEHNGSISSYDSVQEMANSIVDPDKVGPYESNVRMGQYEKAFFGHDFNFGAHTVDEQQATSNAEGSQPTTITRWSETCTVNMADTPPQNFADDRKTLDAFNDSYDASNTDQSTLEEFNGSMADYCGLPDSRAEIIDIGPVFWSEEQNPSTSLFEDIFVDDDKETYEVEVDLDDKSKLNSLEVTETDTVNVTKITWDSASDFKEYLDTTEQENKVRARLSPSEVSSICGSGCLDSDIKDIEDIGGSIVAVTYSYSYEDQEPETDSENIPVSEFGGGSYDNASEVDSSESDSEIESTIADYEPDADDSSDITSWGYNDGSDGDIDYDVTYEVTVEKTTEETNELDVSDIGWADGAEFDSYLNEDGMISELEGKLDSDYNIRDIKSVSVQSVNGDDITVVFSYDTKDPRRWGQGDVTEQLEDQITFTTANATNEPYFDEVAAEHGMNTLHEDSLPDEVDSFNDFANLESLESVDDSSSSHLDLTVKVSNWTKAQNGYMSVVYSKKEELKQTWSWRAVEQVKMGDMATCLYYWEECFEQERTFETPSGTKTHLLYDTGFGPWKGSWSFNWSENQTNESVNQLENLLTDENSEFAANTSTSLSDIYGLSYDKQFDGAHSHIRPENSVTTSGTFSTSSTSSSDGFPSYTLFSFRECNSTVTWLNKNEPGGIYGKHEFLCPSSTYANFKYNSSEESVYDADKSYEASVSTVYRCESNPPTTPEGYHVNRSSEYEARKMDGETYVCRDYDGAFPQWYEAGKPDVSLDSNPSSTGMKVELTCTDVDPNGCNTSSYRLKLYEPGNQPDNCPTDMSDYEVEKGSVDLSTSKYVCGIAKDFLGNKITTSSSVGFENERLGIDFEYPGDSVRISKGDTKRIMVSIVNYEDSQVEVEADLSGLNGFAEFSSASSGTINIGTLSSGSVRNKEIIIDSSGLSTGTHVLEGEATDLETDQTATDSIPVDVVSKEKVEENVPGLTVIQITVITMIASMLYIFRP
jgi:hypothetical protein